MDMVTTMVERKNQAILEDGTTNSGDRYQDATSDHLAGGLVSPLEFLLHLPIVRFCNMADEEASATSSLTSRIFDGLLNAGKEHATGALGASNNQVVKLELARYAAARTVMNGGVKNKDVVISRPIKLMMDAYRIAPCGGSLVVWGPADIGKTHAAEFLMHGDHKFRPDMCLKVSAVAMDDFATEFAENQLHCKQAGYALAEYLCDGLSTSSESIKGMIAKASEGVAIVSCKAQAAVAFGKETMLSVYGPYIERVPNESFQRLPLLIIDNFNVASPANKKFVQQLLQTATDKGVFVFIITTNKEWASTLIKLNGGSKIQPLFGNVNNGNYTNFGSFPEDEDAQWNDLRWDVETLRELIRPSCMTHSLDPLTVITEDLLPLNPRTAMALVFARIDNAESLRLAAAI
jgi:hypothetical protein